MKTTLLHTADWQLGKPFSRINNAEKRTLVRQERLHVIARIRDIVVEKQVSAVLVAGDLFDSPTPEAATVAAACSAIGQLEVPVYVIPGNHDYGGPGGPWEQDFFKREADKLAPNLQVLLEAESVELPDMVLFPCPLMRRQETADPAQWLRSIDAAALAGFGEKPRVLLAHGSVQGFDSEADDEDTFSGVPNLIDLEQLPEGVFDYIALGDWHGTKQVAADAWYAGTPELDRFPKGESNQPGNVLVATVARGQGPAVETVPTARLGWHQLDFEFTSDDDVDQLEQQVEHLVGKRANEDLLRLSLGGSLAIAATTRLESLLESWEARLLRVKLANKTLVAPSEEEIEALTQRAGDPLISCVAAKLVADTTSSDEQGAALARSALRELHAACASN